MMVRDIKPSDIEVMKKIHAQHFNHEFDFEVFRKHFLGAFLVEDSNGVVCAGGVRTICESVIVTDKSRNPEDRKDALLNMLHASICVCNAAGYDELHAFVQDEAFLKRLLRTGFKETKGKSLIFSL